MDFVCFVVYVLKYAHRCFCSCVGCSNAIMSIGKPGHCNRSLPPSLRRPSAGLRGRRTLSRGRRPSAQAGDHQPQISTMAKSQSLRMAPRITLRQTVGIAILIFVAPVAGQSLDLDKQVCVDLQCMSLTYRPQVCSSTVLHQVPLPAQDAVMSGL